MRRGQKHLGFASPQRSREKEVSSLAKELSDHTVPFSFPLHLHYMSKPVPKPKGVVILPKTVKQSQLVITAISVTDVTQFPMTCFLNAIILLNTF